MFADLRVARKGTKAGNRGVRTTVAERVVGGRLVSLELMARAARLLAPTAVAEDTQEGNELQRNRGDRHEHAFDAFRRVFQICFFFVDQRGLLRGAVDAPVFFGIEVARVAGAAVSLLVPALRAGIDQRVMAMGAEVRRFGIGVLAFGADAGCKRWFGLIDVTGFICSAEFSN